MPAETSFFENGAQTYRIQYEIVAPPPSPPKKKGEYQPYAPPAEFKVAIIRVTETTEGVGDDGPRKTINFGRGFATLAQARTGASEYAKRIIREQMAPKPAPAAPSATPAV
jgi:hypothetical protein